MNRLVMILMSCSLTGCFFGDSIVGDWELTDFDEDEIIEAISDAGEYELYDFSLEIEFSLDSDLEGESELKMGYDAVLEDGSTVSLNLDLEGDIEAEDEDDKEYSIEGKLEGTASIRASDFNQEDPVEDFDLKLDCALDGKELTCEETSMGELTFKSELTFTKK